jgi:hypothetical protein
MNEGSMKKASKRQTDEIRREYDFSSMKGGVRGKYVRRLRSGTNLVLLEPEVAKAFPTDAAVNEALRTILRATRTSKRAAGLTDKRTPGARRSRG